jgi:uncharacterized protein YndB with AHSA1/START domain
MRRIRIHVLGTMERSNIMAHAEATITIDRPVKTVFDFLADGMNNLHWRPSVTDIQPVPGKPGAFRQGLKGPGGRIDGDYEITVSQPNELLVFQVTAGPARPTGTYMLEPAGDSTRLTFTLDFQPKGLARLMDPMIASSMRSEVAMLSNLKAYLESQPM